MVHDMSHNFPAGRRAPVKPLIWVPNDPGVPKQSAVTEARPMLDDINVTEKVQKTGGPMAGHSLDMNEWDDRLYPDKTLGRCSVSTTRRCGGDASKLPGRRLCQPRSPNGGDKNTRCI
jgi:hypothetical protein